MSFILVVLAVVIGGGFLLAKFAPGVFAKLKASTESDAALIRKASAEAAAKVAADVAAKVEKK